MLTVYFWLVLYCSQILDSPKALYKLELFGLDIKVLSCVPAFLSLTNIDFVNMRLNVLMLELNTLIHQKL